MAIHLVPYSLTTVLSIFEQSNKKCADFYDELFGEVKNREARCLAAVPGEKMWVMSDTHPPWGF